MASSVARGADVGRRVALDLTFFIAPGRTQEGPFSNLEGIKSRILGYYSTTVVSSLGRLAAVKHRGFKSIRTKNTVLVLYQVAFFKSCLEFLYSHPRYHTILESRYSGEFVFSAHKAGKKTIPTHHHQHEKIIRAMPRHPKSGCVESKEQAPHNYLCVGDDRRIFQIQTPSSHRSKSHN